EDAAAASLAAAHESGDQSEVRGALEELVQVRRMRGDDVGVMRALHELTTLGEQLGDDVFVLDAAVQELESAGLAGVDKRIGEAAIRTFSRLPDESVAQVPELARRVAAQVGADNPAVVQRVLRLVGIGSPTQQAAAGLGRVLEDWGNRDPRVQAFVPAGQPDVNELASATQYLLSNRDLDARTADDLSKWLRAFVTPTNL
ncbi:MAG TPA: hypothetical protein VJT85_06345, partial [Gemmatimonadaceae bacterium]|nr:hypothetical protein [Gemmatimonadaceae bacterium]